jgi:hypothetical protein
MSGGGQSGSAGCPECIPAGKRFAMGRGHITVRTTSKTVTFVHPFNLSGMDEKQPAGTYTVETNKELLQTLSLPAYKRISTLIRLPARPRSTVVTQIVEEDPLELAAALARDAQPDETILTPKRGAGVLPRKSKARRMEIIRGGWQHWVTLNANDLTWMALLVGGVLFTSWLMRG